MPFLDSWVQLSAAKQVLEDLKDHTKPKQSVTLQPES